MKKRYDLCIIGGGAAGLAAAASVDSGISVCILEKNAVPGKKIMATGGGRCNLTNEACKEKDLTLDFFRSKGLETYRDCEGRYYPYSGYAPDVVKILLSDIEKKDIDIVTSAHVISTEKIGGDFVVSYGESGQSTIYSRSVLVACGGKAAPQLGTTGDGYSIAKAMGHTIKRLYPVLTGISCGDFSDLKGIRARGKVSLYRDGNMITEEFGEIQFTRDGISGICVFDITAYIKAEEDEKPAEAMKRFSVKLDLAPDFTDSDLERRESVMGIVTERLAKRLTPETIKRWKLPVLGVKGWRDAQCTAGGVSTEEIDMMTMESKLVPGLYFAGEIIDVQGPCGGFNLQNAWETGIRAAMAINGRFG